MDYIQQTIQSYEDYFEQYADKKSGTGSSEKLLEKFVSFLKGKDILEIGFGVGNDTGWFIKNKFNYTGVDPVKNFYDLLRSKFPQVKFINQNILKTGFKPGSFDGIWAMAIFLHLNDGDLKIVLNKCHSWLKKDGIIFVSLKEGRGQKIKGDGRYFNYFSQVRFTKMIQGKFKVVHFQKNPPQIYNTGNQNWLSFYLQKIS